MRNWEALLNGLFFRRMDKNLLYVFDYVIIMYFFERAQNKNILKRLIAGIEYGPLKAENHRWDKGRHFERWQ